MTPSKKQEKAIVANAFAKAKGILGNTEVFNAYVENKHLVLQLATCRFKIANK